MANEPIETSELAVIAEAAATHEKKLLKEKKDENKELITIERYRISAEKLQLGWLRKSIAISALGFTAYRLLEEETAKAEHDIFGFLGAGEIGLLLLLIGFVGLVWATRQHLVTIEKIRRQYNACDQKLPRSVSLIESYAIIVITILLAIYSIVRYIRL